MENSILDILKSRDENIVQPILRSIEGTKVKFQDPNSQVLSSDDILMYHEFIISTEDPDRVGDVVVSKGCLPFISNYKNNPIVLLNHNREGFPIAKSENPLNGEFCFDVKDRHIVAKAFFHCKTEESEKTYELVKLKYIRGASIGFNPIKYSLIKYKQDNKDSNIIQFPEYGLKIEEWDMSEWSVVNTPCQSRALAKDFDLDGFKSWLSKNAKETEFYNNLKSSLPEETSITVPVTIPEIKKEEEDVKPEILESFKKEIEDKIKEITESLKVIKETKEKEIVLETPPVPVAETPEESKPEKKKEPPIGVKILQKICKGLEDLCTCAMEKLEQVDNKKTETFIQEVHNSLEATHKGIKKYGRKNYSNHFEEDKSLDEEILKENESDLKKLQEQKEAKEQLEKEIEETNSKKQKEKESLDKLTKILESLQASKKKLDDKIYSLVG